MPRWAIVTICLAIIAPVALVFGLIAIFIGGFMMNNGTAKATAASFNAAVDANLMSVTGVTESTIRCELNSHEAYQYDLEGAVTTTATTREELIDIATDVYIALRTTRNAANSGQPKECDTCGIYVKSADKQISIGTSYARIAINDRQIKAFLNDWSNTSIYSCTAEGECRYLCESYECNEADYAKLHETTETP